MNIKEIAFSVNSYDIDGDIIEEGVFLHFGDTRVLAASNIKEFKEMVHQIEEMVKEIEEIYV